MGLPASGANGGDPGPPFESVRDELQRLLAAPAFADAPRLSSLLSFLVEQTICGHAEELKETVIAVEVFGRPADFDPRSDSVVRVQVRNLRAKLRAYYDGSGREDTVRFELPTGSYVPVFQARLPAAEKKAPSRNRFARLGIVLACGMLILAGLTVALRRAGFHWSERRHSIAVLPFLNLTGNAASDYFVDGFVDELTTSLAQVRDLKVVARSSAFQFRSKSLDVRAIGKQLGASTILEGSILSAGRSVRITAQLINTEDGFHLWSHTYEGSAAEIIAMQAEIAAGVSSALDLAAPATSPRHRPDLQAYDLYLQGRYFKERVTLEDLGRSIQLLEQAVQRDPDFAEAHASLADACASLAYHQLTPDSNLISRAKAEAQRAIALSPSLAEAHALLAWIWFFYDWNWQDAERGLRRAVQLNPNSARAHDWYSQYLLSAKRLNDAAAESRSALLLDPLNYRVSTNLCVIYYCAHRYDDAIRQARLTLEINPHYYQAHSMLGASLQEQHRLAEAATALRAAAAEYAGDADTRAHRAVVEAGLGDGNAIPEAIATLSREPGTRYELAYLHLALGDRTRALELLEQSFREHSSDVVFLNVDPAFDSLRHEAGFRALQAKMGWK